MTARFGDDRLPERFWAKVVEKESGCWEWTAAMFVGGYGAYQLKTRTTRRAHRVAYEHLVAAVPAELQLDHLCRNRACCNPGHLEPVTPRVNTLRGEGRCAANARKTGCRFPEHGPYDRLAGGERSCKKCCAITMRGVRARKALA